MMWQTRLGTCIYTSKSGYKVHQNFFYRWLTLGSNTLQTVISRHNIKRPILYYLPELTLMARKNPDTCCLLGLGGAGVVHMLRSERVHPAITAVDSSDEVIHIAKQFFMADSIPNLTIIHQNANDYIRESPTRYAHLLIDLYDANQFPSECNTDDFFQNCKQILKPNGFLSLNLANVKEQWSIFQLVKSHFTNTIVLPIKKCANIIIIASNEGSTNSFLQKLEESGEIQKFIWDPSWGYAGQVDNPGNSS
jgi:spermidine synthase